ncbi:MAG: hypothetical protein C4K58_05665 [Flavobacteriaceae bacterium]|nr:MAG: hypothetical protein C4K58_05665 [Flavobacteriaceae bacterium]
MKKSIFLSFMLLVQSLMLFGQSNKNQQKNGQENIQYVLTESGYITVLVSSNNWIINLSEHGVIKDIEVSPKEKLEYDLLGRISKIGDQVVVYNLITGLIDKIGDATLVYEPVFWRLNSIGNTINFQYDLFGRITKVNQDSIVYSVVDGKVDKIGETTIGYSLHRKVISIKPLKNNLRFKVNINPNAN